MIGEMKIRPHSLPALEVCPGFKSASDSVSNYALDGIDRHDALESMFRGDGNIAPEFLHVFDHHSIEGIKWAYERVNFLAPLADYPLEIETPIKIRNHVYQDYKYWTEIPGRIDYRCGDIVFDFKWRYRDYESQMAAYCLGLMQLRGSDTAEAYLLFGESQKEEHFKFTKSEAWEIVNQTIETAAESNRLYPSEYCLQCAKHITCKAVLANVHKVVEYEEPELGKLEEHFETDPEARAKALRIAKVSARWAKAYNARSNKFAMTGKDFPGFELKAERGQLSIANLQAAFEHSGLDEKEFIECCSASFNSIAEARARKHSIPLATSKRELKRMLDGYLKEGETKYYLVEKLDKKK